MAAGTGHGATLTVGGTAIPLARQITGHEETQPQVDASHLGTPGPARDYVPADLADAAPMAVEALWDTEDANGLLALGGTPQAIVYTLKKTGGATGTPANWTGTGFLTRRKYPDSISNEVMLVEYDLQWVGTPVWTPETLA